MHARMYDACIYDISMMRLKFCDQRTNERTNKAILGVGCVRYGGFEQTSGEFEIFFGIFDRSHEGAEIPTGLTSYSNHIYKEILSENYHVKCLESQ